ncbi:class I SAM-dependent methyltransferase [Vibrio sp. S4M6]|uniref:class I SAM-dependent methyltransferase n=1 Tax=Vibrio sinus TaxID=2946865 RepID=UPI002029D0AF|nr:class I SAM-dependent methyltransferase [Vibrio sinus]MCL9782047.1 class I SAM-dependent methyltransferase [Vibrio sinus]
MQVEKLPAFFEHIESELQTIPNELRRLFHGRGQCWQGLEQLTCDWLQGQLVVNVFKDANNEFIGKLIDGLVSFSKTQVWKDKQGKSIALQHRYLEGAPTETVVGELQSSPVVVENGIRYQLDIGRNQNFGLFLDMRLGREWVKQHTAGKRVLNLFSYTCGFSLAAIEGGASHVVNLDMAKASLSKGRENHRLNEHDLAKVTFLAHDVFKSWGKLRKLGPYDLIVIDPPSFQKGSFALTKDYQKILRRLPDMLAQHGQVLACVNSPAVSPQFLIDGMANEAPELTFIERINNPPEFVESDLDKGLKVMLFSRS